MNDQQLRERIAYLECALSDQKILSTLIVISLPAMGILSEMIPGVEQAGLFRFFIPLAGSVMFAYVALIPRRLFRVRKDKRRRLDKFEQSAFSAKK